MEQVIINKISPNPSLPKRGNSNRGNTATEDKLLKRIVSNPKIMLVKVE